MRARGRAAAAVAAALLALGARADEWALEPRAQWRLESDDNLALQPQAGPGRRWTRLDGGATVTRGSEVDTTRLDLALGHQGDDGTNGSQRTGRIEGAQQLRLPRDTLDATLAWAQDDRADDATRAADAALARTTRRTRSAQAGWVRRLDERTRLSLSGSRDGVRYGSGHDDADYDSRALAAGVSGQWDERRGWTLRLARSAFAQPALQVRSVSDSLSGGLTLALAETAHASASVGAFHTRTDRSGSMLVCPLDEVYCRAGIVARVAAPVQQRQQGDGFQYELALERSAGERTEWRLAAQRALATGAGGITRNDRLEAQFTHRFTPEGAATLRATRSHDRATTDAGNGPQPRLLTLEASLQWALAERWTLAGAVVRRDYTEAQGAVQAHSNAFSISLQYQGPRLVSAR